MRGGSRGAERAVRERYRASRLARSAIDRSIDRSRDASRRHRVQREASAPLPRSGGLAAKIMNSPSLPPSLLPSLPIIRKLIRSPGRQSHFPLSRRYRIQRRSANKNSCRHGTGLEQAAACSLALLCTCDSFPDSFDSVECARGVLETDMLQFLVAKCAPVRRPAPKIVPEGGCSLSARRFRKRIATTGSTRNAGSADNLIKILVECGCS
jgi:hypothetical protein